jgi:protein O-mannosyl-transferase
MIEDRSKNLFLIVILTLAGLFAYYNTLDNPFVYDDLFIIKNNRALDDPRNMKALFGHEYFPISGERSYRPVSTALVFLDTAIGGRNPFVFRVTSIFLHAANGVFIFLILFALTRRRGVSWIAALLFLLHPIQTEAVDGISFVEDLLAAFFFLAALLCWIKSRSGGKILLCFSGALVFFLMAVFSKECAGMLPFVILVFEWAFGGAEPFRRHARGRGVRLAMIFAAAAAFLLLRFIVFVNPVSGAAAKYPGAGLVHSIPVVVAAFLKYLSLFFYPRGLSIEHCFPGVIPWASGVVIISILLHVLILATGVSLRRISPVSSFGALFYLAGLIPISNIVPFGAVMAERYFYMPSIGLCILIVGIAFKVASAIDARSRTAWVAAALLLCWCVSLGFATVRQNRVWSDELYLWKAAVGVCPSSSRARTGYGLRLIRTADSPEAVREAIRQLETAVRIDPRHYEAYLSLGTAYWHYGRLNKALQTYLRVYGFHPTNDVRYNIALLYTRVERPEKAIPYLLEIVAQEPKWVAARYLLGNAYLKMGDLRGAREQYLYVLKLNPGNLDTEGNLGVVFFEMNELDAAQAIFDEVLERAPGNEHALLNLKRIREAREKSALRKE